jgi:hypothetical protein
MRKRLNRMLFIIFCFALSGTIENCFGQAELQAWGNITGIRVQGELMGFESSLCVAGNNWSSVTATGKEQQSPKFRRDSIGRQVVVTQLGGISFTETVTDAGTGKALVTIRFLAARDTSIAGSFFCIRLSKSDYNTGTITFGRAAPVSLESLKPDSAGNLLRATIRDLNVRSAQRQFNIQCQGNEFVFVRQGSISTDPALEIYLPLQSGKLEAGQSGEKTFILEATGQIDFKDIHLTLDASNQGRVFAGFGGNFRIQNLKNDPAVIDYCLNNMRVAWGRVEMPWRFWQPEKNNDPVATAKAGHLDDHVQRAMAMAQKLAQKEIPVILTAWAPPAWAIIGKPHYSHSADEPWGNPLNPDSAAAIYKSIADYIQYLQDQYGVSIRFFSFNESDLGIYVRQTGGQHLELIKGLGKYFLDRGLKTKMLLGDNSDATTYSFIEPALKDESARPYIGAVSFHSWRGWEHALLSQWASASREINLPLIVGEGSIDAAAWAYPDIFLEPTYSMQEINLYIRLLAICQPLSILQWQLTSDYSPLTGGGIFGKQGPLEPTRRFWNLKQLASTPENLNYLPVSCDRSSVTCAALGNAENKKYVVHIVNNGAERKLIINGIPGAARVFKIITTSRSESMKEGKPVAVNDGKAEFILTADSYTTIVSQ